MNRWAMNRWAMIRWAMIRWAMNRWARWVAFAIVSAGACQPMPVDDAGAGDSNDHGDSKLDDGDDSDAPPPAWADCEVPSDCILVAAGCCQPCEMPTLDDVDAVHRDRLEEHLDDVCPGGTSPCPGCPSVANPALIATCQAGSCRAIDVRDHPVNTCTDDAFCRVRVRDCCECGSDTRLHNLIALPTGAEQEFTTLVCDPDWACPECEPTYPDNVHARCIEESCQLVVE